MRKYAVIIAGALCLTLLILSARAFHSRVYQKEADPAAYDHTAYIYPAEFESQQSVWMQWPAAAYNTGSHPVYQAMLDIIKALDPYIKIDLLAQSEEDAARIRDLLKTSGYSGTNLRYHIINHLSIWARDVGPVFIKDNENNFSVVNFGFNNYSRGGNSYYISVESQVDNLIAQLLKLPVINTGLISEGGAIESNGRGTLMIIERVALNRNPELTGEQIENEYKRVLGLKKVIWLKRGLAEDEPITGGHINEVARFANPGTVLLARVAPEDRYASPAAQQSYLNLEENYKILSGATDQDGKPFRIIRIPMPPAIYGETANSGEVPVCSYLNYLVTNGLVLMQTYWKPGRPDTLKKTEDQVRQIFQDQFPGRKIIGIDAENINWWGGGIHCITQYMPAN